MIDSGRSKGGGRVNCHRGTALKNRDVSRLKIWKAQRRYLTRPDGSVQVTGVVAFVDEVAGGRSSVPRSGRRSRFRGNLP